MRKIRFKNLNFRLLSMSFEIQDLGLFNGDVRAVILSECEGATVPYKSNIPDLFETPVKISDDGNVWGISSGRRSALVYENNEWYKLKGVCPSDKTYQVEDNPLGGQKRSAAIQELDASDLMSEYGRKKGVVAALEPVCYFDYDIPFQGETVCASVLKTRGDMRLSNFYNRFLKTLQHLHENNLNSDYTVCSIKKYLTNRIGEWLGFWYGSFEDKDMCWGSVLLDMDRPPYFRVFDTNVGLDNIAIYNVEGGIGISMIDLDRHMETNERIKKFELNRIERMLEIFDGALHFLEYSNNTESILHWILDRWAASLGEGLTAFSHPEEMFDVALPEEFEIIDYFESGRKGRVPEPIDTEHFVGPIENSIELFI